MVLDRPRLPRNSRAPSLFVRFPTSLCFSIRPHAANIFRRRYSLDSDAKSALNSRINSSHRSFREDSFSSNVRRGSTRAARSAANGLSHQKFTAIAPDDESTQCHHPSGTNRQSPARSTRVSSGGISAPVPSWSKNSGNRSLGSASGSYAVQVTSTPLWFADSPSGLST